MTAHAEKCLDKRCGCRTYIKNYSRWIKELPFTPEDQPNTYTPHWLWHTLSPSFKWCCRVCGGPGEKTCGLHSKRKLQRHLRSSLHIRAVERLLQRKPSVTDTPNSAPSEKSFLEFFEAFRNGTPVRDGMHFQSGLCLGTQKAKK